VLSKKPGKRFFTITEAGLQPITAWLTTWLTTCCSAYSQPSVQPSIQPGVLHSLFLSKGFTSFLQLNRQRDQNLQSGFPKGVFQIPLSMGNRNPLFLWGFTVALRRAQKQMIVAITTSNHSTGGKFNLILELKNGEKHLSYSQIEKIGVYSR
jgi:hypothetical protein